MSVSSPPEYLRPREAAKIVGVHWKTLKGMDVPYITVGPSNTHRRYLREDLDRWVAEHRVNG